MSIVGARRIVVKVGTSTLTYENGKPNFRAFESLARVLSDLKNSGKEIILVSSGAISVGLSSMGLQERPKEVRFKQAASAVGQCELMFTYDMVFSEYSQAVAQILLNRDTIKNPERTENVRNTFSALLELGVIPIVNENDSVAVEEIVFGDNDSLSAIVAILAGADALLILTDIDGLYDSDPSCNPDAKRIPRVDQITGELMSAAGGAGSSRGTGGMHTKLEAAKLSTEAGIDTVVMSGKDMHALYDVLDGKPVGTLFTARR